MGKGRPKKDTSIEAMARRTAAGERVKAFRMEYGTQEEAAELLSVDVSTMRRYESGGQDIPDDAARIIERETGVVSHYWQGVFDYQMTRTEYNQYVISEMEWQKQQDQENEEALAAFEAAINERKRLFAALGYEYELRYKSYAYEDFAPTMDVDAAQDAYKPHTLTRHGSTETRYYFTDAGFFALIEKLQSTIAFACYENDRMQPTEKAYTDITPWTMTTGKRYTNKSL